MKNFKTTMILLGVLAGLLAVTGIVNLVQKSSSGSKSKNAVFKKFNPAEATSFSVQSRANTASLNKKNGIWLTDDGFPVDTAALNKAFGHIDSLTTKQLVSRNPKKQGIFEVDSVKGVQVKVAAGNDTVVSLFLGKSGSDYNSTYFRAGGKDEVYLYGSGIKWTFDKGTKSWRDTYVLKVKPDDVTSFILTYPDGELEVVRGMDSQWRIARPLDSAAKQSEVSGLVGALANMNSSAMQKMEGPVDYGFAKPVCTARVVMKSGAAHTVVIGKFDAEKKQYSVKREGGAFVYTVSEHQGSSVMKKFEELKEEPKDTTKTEEFEKK